MDDVEENLEAEAQQIARKLLGDYPFIASYAYTDLIKFDNRDVIIDKIDQSENLAGESPSSCKRSRPRPRHRPSLPRPSRKYIPRLRDLRPLQMSGIQQCGPVVQIVQIPGLLRS